MPRLALIAGTYQPKQCGVAHYTYHLRNALAQRGMASVVLTTTQAAIAADDPTVIGAVKGWQISDLLPLVRAVHRTQADLLHIQHAAGTYGFERAIFLLPLLLRLTGWRSPIVTTLHEYGWWEWQPAWLPPHILEALKTWGQQKRWWDREDGFLLTLSDALITTNENAEQVVCDRLPTFKPKLCQIPIGANVEVTPTDRQQARQQVRQGYGWAEDAPIIAFFGFLHPVKGLETLLPAFKQVLTQHPEARLLLVGGVESLALQNEQATRYWDQLKMAIASLDLNSQVHMTGYLDERTASQCLAAADIGVLPFNHGVTLKSGSLLTLMAHALPVVATRSNPPDPNLNESLVELINPRNVDELTHALTNLLNHPERRSQLASAGQRFSQKFAWSTIADAHLKIYEAVLAQETIALSELIA